MIKATPEQVEAAMVAFGRVYTGPRTEIAAYTAALNAALNVAPAGEIALGRLPLPSCMEGPSDPCNGYTALYDYVIGLNRPPSTVPVARDALVEAETALTKLADDMTNNYWRGGIAIRKDIDEALAKIKSALAATDNPEEGK